MSLPNSTILISMTLFLLGTMGCNSTVNRFMMKSIAQIDDPVHPAPSVVSEPFQPGVGLSIAWAGHATVLIQMGDRVFLTDPLFTNTVGIMMKRTVEPGIDPRSLTKIDYVLVSHIHFDHFSYGSLEMLPKDLSLLVPFGALPYTPEFGFRELREMEPWEVVEENGVRITAVPVQHFSGRYGFDIMWMQDRGYTGYVVEYRGITVFFAGDTGYHPDLFKEIGRRFKIDLAVLPISPVEPRAFMARNHVDPREAIQIFRDVGARFFFPMHHRTLDQGFDPSPTYAIEQLRTIAAETGISHQLLELDIGEQRIISATPPASSR